MKRKIIAVLAAFCVIYISTFSAFASGEPYTADLYFWTIGRATPGYFPIEEYSNDEPFDPGIGSTDLGSRFLLIGAKYNKSELEAYQKYRFDITLVTTPTVSIRTEGYEDRFVLYSSFISNVENSYGVREPSLYYYSNGGNRCDRSYAVPTITRDAQTVTFSFTDISWTFLQFFNDATCFISIPDFTMSITGDMYLANLYFGLESEYDEEGYAKAVNEKLDAINESIQDGNDKLDEMLEQDKEQHEENKGFFQTIIDGITSLPDLIKNAFKNLIDEIVSSVTGSIEESMNDFLDKLKERLGILYQAPDYFIRIIQSIMVTETSNELIFPSMVIPVNGEEYTFNEPTPFQIFPDWIPGEVYTFINLAFSIVVIFSVINYAEKKWEDITKNG